MSLVDDILLLARCASPSDRRAYPASVRVLAAHDNGGLPRALAGEILAGAERRLTALIQTEIEAMTKAAAS
jgi:hypothetical protein